jgi:hypothetical protein
MPALISIGDRAFFTFSAPFLLLQVECACSNLEVIGTRSFYTLEYGSTSSIILTDLSRLQSVGTFALGQIGTDATNRHDVVLTGMSPLLSKIGAYAFR